MFLLHKMVARSERHKMSVVRGRWNGHAAGTAHVRVTQLIRQHLKVIRIEVIVVPEDMIVGGATCSLSMSQNL